MDISVVIPMYGCRAAVPELYRRLTETVKKIAGSYEIIMVDDCCPQNSWEEIEKLCSKDEHVVGIHLSRNFGQIRAITAGLDYCKGDWVVVMDCDLQDRPESIIDLYNKANEGYDVVFTKRQGRKDTFLTKFMSRCFYRVYNYFTDGNYDPAICNFSIARRVVIDYYCQMREQNRAYTMFVKWLGFRQTSIELQEDKRFEGKSSYSFRKKLNLAFEVITSQSNKPLKFSIHLGFTIALIALIYIIYLIIRTLAVGDVLTGWTTIVASIYLMGGLILASVGIVGIYTGNIFNETKKRPIYIVEKCLNGQVKKPEE